MEWDIDGNGLVTDGSCMDADGNELDDNIWLETDGNGIATNDNGVDMKDNMLNIDGSGLDDSDNDELEMTEIRIVMALELDSIITIDSHSDGEISSNSASPDEVKCQGKRKYTQECAFQHIETVVCKTSA